MIGSLLAGGPERSFAEADFLIGPGNEAAFRLVLDPARWGARALRLSGPAGAGKSHLAAIFSASGLGEMIDEAAPDETGWFHRLNALGDDARLLLVIPAGWQPVLPDLASRLGALPEARLAEPDEALAEAVIAKGFADRQLRVPAELPRYLALRSERSFAAMRALVERIDAEALARGKAPSLKLARALLERMDAPVLL